MAQQSPKQLAAQILKPENVPPDFMSYVIETAGLNLKDLNAGQILGAARYAWQYAVDATQTEIVNSGSDTTIFSQSIGGGTLGTQGALQLIIFGDYKNNSGATRTFTVTVNYGGTTMFKDTSGNTTDNATRIPMLFHFYLTGANSTSAQNLIGELRMPVIGGGGYSATTGGGDLSASGAVNVYLMSGTAAEDSTLNKTLEVKFQHSTNNNSLSYRQFYAVLTKIGH